MNRKTFLVLAVVAVVAVLAAVATTLKTPAPEQTLAGKKLFPDLLDKVNAVEAVILQTPEGTLTLQRGVDGWKLLERGGWPAQADRVRALLLGLAQAETIEAKTARAEHYGDLGVEDPGTGSAVGIEVLDGGGKRLAAVIAGHEKFASGLPVGRYLRKPGEAQSWLARATLPLGDDAADWLEREILNIPTSEIVRVALSHPDGDRWTGSRETPEAKHLTVPGVELETAFAIDDVAGVLTDLTLDDVRPGDEVKVADKYLHHGRFETGTGLALTTRLATVMNEDWLWLDVEGEGTEAEALRDTVSGWAFKIPAFKAVRLKKHLADLKKKPKTAKTAE